MTRKVWKNSRHESVDSEGRVYYVDAPCMVFMDDRSIEIRYEDTDGDMVNYVCIDVSSTPLLFVGKKAQSGERVGDARLQMIGNRFLEGEWHEGTRIGDWYITLK